MHEDNLKKQLLFGFIALSYKFSNIEDLRAYLSNFYSRDLNSTQNENVFYSFQEFNMPEFDEDWIENQIKYKKIYREDLVRYVVRNKEKIGVVKEIIDKNCIVVSCTANCSDKDDYDTVFINNVIEVL